MSRPNFATMQAPDPKWGARLAGPEARHLEFYDESWRKPLRNHRWMVRVGMAMLAVGIASALLPLGIPRAFSVVPGIIGVVGFFNALTGAWVLWRMSFAVHRMWGVYERGFVAPWYRKGGMRLLTPWTDVKLLRFRRMKGVNPQTKSEEERFLIRAVDNGGFIHRFWETELTEAWKFTPQEAAAFREAFLAAAQKYLPAEKVVVEHHLSEDGTP